MNKNWPERAEALLSILEGGSPHEVKGDVGGRTSAFGVTQNTYNRFRKGKGLPVRDVFDIERHEETTIFKNGYWDICSCDDLEDGRDLAVFQMAVNLGPYKTIKLMQKSAEVKDDGILGPISMTAILCCDTDIFLENLFDYQYNEYHKIVKRNPTMKMFLKGWTNRILKTADFIDMAYMPPE